MNQSSASGRLKAVIKGMGSWGVAVLNATLRRTNTPDPEGNGRPSALAIDSRRDSFSDPGASLLAHECVELRTDTESYFDAHPARAQAYAQMTGRPLTATTRPDREAGHLREEGCRIMLANVQRVVDAGRQALNRLRRPGRNKKPDHRPPLDIVAAHEGGGTAPNALISEGWSFRATNPDFDGERELFCSITRQQAHRTDFNVVPNGIATLKELNVLNARVARGEPIVLPLEVNGARPVTEPLFDRWFVVSDEDEVGRKVDRDEHVQRVAWALATRLELSMANPFTNPFAQLARHKRTIVKGRYGEDLVPTMATLGGMDVPSGQDLVRASCAHRLSADGLAAGLLAPAGTKAVSNAAGILMDATLGPLEQQVSERVAGVPQPTFRAIEGLENDQLLQALREEMRRHHDERAAAAERDETRIKEAVDERIEDVARVVRSLLDTSSVSFDGARKALTAAAGQLDARRAELRVTLTAVEVDREGREADLDAALAELEVELTTRLARVKPGHGKRVRRLLEEVQDHVAAIAALGLKHRLLGTLRDQLTPLAERMRRDEQAVSSAGTACREAEAAERRAATAVWRDCANSFVRPVAEAEDGERWYTRVAPGTATARGSLVLAAAPPSRWLEDPAAARAEAFAAANAAFDSVEALTFDEFLADKFGDGFDLRAWLGELAHDTRAWLPLDVGVGNGPYAESSVVFRFPRGHEHWRHQVDSDHTAMAEDPQRLTVFRVWSGLTIEDIKGYAELHRQYEEARADPDAPLCHIIHHLMPESEDTLMYAAVQVAMGWYVFKENGYVVWEVADAPGIQLQRLASTWPAVRDVLAEDPEARARCEARIRQFREISGDEALLLQLVEFCQDPSGPEKYHNELVGLVMRFKDRYLAEAERRLGSNAATRLDMWDAEFDQDDVDEAAEA